MPIVPICDSCGMELDVFGALLFSPPNGDHVRKYHLCPKCFEDITKGFRK